MCGKYETCEHTESEVVCVNPPRSKFCLKMS